MEDTLGVLAGHRGESIGKHPTVGAKHPPGEPPLIATD